MENNKYEAIVFDMDGTLLNTLVDLQDSTNHVLKSHGFPERSYEEIRSFVGNGIKKLVELALPKEAVGEFLETCYQEMLAYYGEHSQIKTAPYDGIIELLEKLKTMGYKLALVTNKDQSAADAIGEKFFNGFFTCILGDNQKAKLKPAPDRVWEALDIMGVEKKDAVYIGDSEVDALTAKNSELDFIGVCYGFRDRQVLVDNGATKISESPLGILNFV